MFLMPLTMRRGHRVIRKLLPVKFQLPVTVMSVQKEEMAGELL